MDQVQSELQEWQGPNSASAKQGMKQQQAGAKQGRCGSVTLGSAAGVSKMGSGRKGSVHDLSFGLRSSQGGGGDTDSMAVARDAANAAGDDDSEQTRRPSGEKALLFKPRKATVSPMDLAPPAPLSVFPSRETISTRLGCKSTIIQFWREAHPVSHLECQLGRGRSCATAALRHRRQLIQEGSDCGVHTNQHGHLAGILMRNIVRLCRNTQPLGDRHRRLHSSKHR
jgi:hypothetical protein